MADSNPNKLFQTLFCSVLFLFGKTPTIASMGNSAGICSENLHKILPPPFSDLSNLSCSPIWERRFAFRFYQDSQNVSTIVLSGKHDNRWIGMAFSGDGKMVGSSAVVGWAGKNGVSGIKQYLLEGKTTSQVIPNKGNLVFTKAKPVVLVDNDTIYIAFQLQFSFSLAFQPILMAIGDGNPLEGDFLPPHIHKLSTVVAFYPTVRERDVIRKYHGLAGIVGWGILTPLGVMLGRYFRHLEPSWYYLHSFTTFMGFFFGLISTSLGRALSFQLDPLLSTHKFVGFTAFALSGLEICQFVLRPSRDSKLQRYWNFSHHWMGRLATILGVLNIFIGFQGVEVGIKVTFVIFFSFLLILIIVLERRLRRENALKYAEQQQPPVFLPDNKQKIGVR